MRQESSPTQQQPARCLVIKPVLHGPTSSSLNAEAALAEACGLARAISLQVIAAEVVRVNRPSPALLLGQGTVTRLHEQIEQQKINLVVIDHALTPIQQRNLEQDWRCKVIDRTGLILEIFGERARTREGQLQVELAALNYQRTRLVRSWTHLERQRGGFGFLGGPGETQLEIDKRLIATRIKKIKKELADVRRTRGLQRKNRTRHQLPTVALVGYTNAGKSTLFNCLSDAEVLAKDMLFATLDPTMRLVRLPNHQQVMLADTVGFIADLPTQLIEAFRATLEEVQEADLILHVRDIASTETRQQRDDVLNVLAEIGIEADDRRLLEVLNKVDLLPTDAGQFLTEQGSRLSADSQHQNDAAEPTGHRAGQVAISARTGQGVPELQELMADFFVADPVIVEIKLPHSAGAAYAWLHQHAVVLGQTSANEAQVLTVKISQDQLTQFTERFTV